MKQQFQKYSTESIHFLNDTPLPAVLELKLKETRQNKPSLTLLDLDSGDGAWRDIYIGFILTSKLVRYSPFL